MKKTLTITTEKATSIQFTFIILLVKKYDSIIIVATVMIREPAKGPPPSRSDTDESSPTWIRFSVSQYKCLHRSEWWKAQTAFLVVTRWKRVFDYFTHHRLCTVWDVSIQLGGNHSLRQRNSRLPPGWPLAMVCRLHCEVRTANVLEQTTYSSATLCRDWRDFY